MFFHPQKFNLDWLSSSSFFWQELIRVKIAGKTITKRVAMCTLNWTFLRRFGKLPSGFIFIYDYTLHISCVVAWSAGRPLGSPRLSLCGRTKMSGQILEDRIWIGRNMSESIHPVRSRCSVTCSLIAWLPGHDSWKMHPSTSTFVWFSLVSGLKLLLRAIVSWPAHNFQLGPQISTRVWKYLGKAFGSTASKAHLGTRGLEQKRLEIQFIF